MHDLRYNCPKCNRSLENVMEAELTGRDLRDFDPQRTHVTGGRYVERRPIGIKIVGECPMHGLQKKIPAGPALPC